MVSANQDGVSDSEVTTMTLAETLERAGLVDTLIGEISSRGNVERKMPGWLLRSRRTEGA